MQTALLITRMRTAEWSGIVETELKYVGQYMYEMFFFLLSTLPIPSERFCLGGNQVHDHLHVELTQLWNGGPSEPPSVKLTYPKATTNIPRNSS